MGKGGEEEKLCSHDDLPLWAQDNDFILRGYRTPGGTSDELQARLDRTTSNANSTAATSALSNGTSKSKDSVRDARERSVNGSKEKREGETATIKRFEHDSVYKCWRSVWDYVHNETVNIHTHFWGVQVTLLAIALHALEVLGWLPATLQYVAYHPIFYPEAIPAPTRTTLAQDTWRAWLSGNKGPSSHSLAPTFTSLVSLPSLRPSLLSPLHAMIAQRPNDWKDVAGFSIFLCAAIICLGFSSFFHTVACHSKDFAHRCNKLDYIGIVVMIVGSFLPALHYGFYCHPHLQAGYAFMITTLGSGAMYTVMSRKYSTPAYRPIRTSVFLALGLSAIVPVAHIWAMYGFEAISRTMGVHWLIASGAMYVVGACTYMMRVPERFSPGTFDYFGASHQIFHCFILAAAFAHYVCIRRAYAFWHTVEAVSGPSNGGAQAVCLALEALRHA